jgi:outer membrane protein TolC
LRSDKSGASPIIASQGQLEFAREALIAIIGEAPDLSDLNETYPISSPNPKSQEQWVGMGLTNNFSLKAAKLATRASKRNAQSKLSDHFPDVDLVPNVTRNNSRQPSFAGGNFSFEENYIEDRKSKFGTLCKVKSNLILNTLLWL